MLGGRAAPTATARGRRLVGALLGQQARQRRHLRLQRVAARDQHRPHKGFQAADGERVTIVEFASEEGMRIWVSHPEHVAAKRLGRGAFFSGYHVQLCQLLRDSADRPRQAG